MTGRAARGRQVRTPAASRFWLGGRHVVLAALLAGRATQLALLSGGRGLEELVALAGARGVPVQWVERMALEAMAGPDAQGCAAWVSPLPTVDLETLLARLPRQRRCLLVALDHLQDPHNLGAIARSAEAAGASGLMIPTHRAAGLTAAVERAAVGALQYLPVAQAHNLPQALDRCRQDGFWIYGSAGDGEVDYRAASLAERSVLVVGGEERGMGPLVRRHCDQVLRLPLWGRTQSLNASVAAAILIYEWARLAPPPVPH